MTFFKNKIKKINGEKINFWYILLHVVLAIYIYIYIYIYIHFLLKTVLFVFIIFNILFPGIPVNYTDVASIDPEYAKNLQVS